MHPWRGTPLVRETHPKRDTPTNMHIPGEDNSPAETHIPEERYVPTEGEQHSLATTQTTKVTQKMGSPTNPQKESIKVIGKPPSSTNCTFNNPHPSGFPVKQPALHSTPKEMFSGLTLETFATGNQWLVASPAKQSLIKCHPDLFNGDVTMFHWWKRSFKAVVMDADVAADQEINCLRSYSNGEPQQLILGFHQSCDQNWKS